MPAFSLFKTVMPNRRLSFQWNLLAMIEVKSANLQPPSSYIYICFVPQHQNCLNLQDLTFL